MTHTPGPWRECGHEKKGCVCRQVWSLPTDCLVAVALMAADESFTAGDGLTDIEEAKANARLIAAAPELLEALEGCEKLLRRGNATYAEFLSTADLARNAIQRARGEA